MRTMLLLEEFYSLTSGIGKEFFNFITPEVAKISYKKSLDIALKQGEKQNVIDLEYRISLLDKIKNIKLEMDRCTLTSIYLCMKLTALKSDTEVFRVLTCHYISSFIIVYLPFNFIQYIYF